MRPGRGTRVTRRSLTGPAESEETTRPNARCVAWGFAWRPWPAHRRLTASCTPSGPDRDRGALPASVRASVSTTSTTGRTAARAPAWTSAAATPCTTATDRRLGRRATTAPSAATTSATTSTAAGDGAGPCGGRAST